MTPAPPTPIEIIGPVTLNSNPDLFVILGPYVGSATALIVLVGTLIVTGRREQRKDTLLRVDANRRDLRDTCREISRTGQQLMTVVDFFRSMYGKAQDLESMNRSIVDVNRTGAEHISLVYVGKTISAANQPILDALVAIEVSGGHLQAAVTNAIKGGGAPATGSDLDKAIKSSLSDFAESLSTLSLEMNKHLLPTVVEEVQASPGKWSYPKP